MAYPTYGQLISSTEELVDDLRLERSVSGAAKVRSFYTAEKRRFVVRHKLTAAQRAELVTYYHNNRTTTFSFTWQKTGTAYTCIFEAAPKLQEDEYPYTLAICALSEQ